jgi:hypothetical protein
VKQQFAQLGHAIETDEGHEGEHTYIMPCNWPSFLAFLECSTQWRVAATMAGLFWVGLDYGACKAVLEDQAADRHVFADIRHMEREALPILNEAV